VYTTTITELLTVASETGQRLAGTLDEDGEKLGDAPAWFSTG
jgi:hypothetical protein